MEKKDIELFNRKNVENFNKFDNNRDIEFMFEEEDFEEFLNKDIIESKGRKRTQATIYSEIYILRRYFAVYKTLSKSNFASYKNTLLDNDVNISSINLIISSINTYYKFLGKKYKNPELEVYKIAKKTPLNKVQFIDNVITRGQFDYLINNARENFKVPNVYLSCKLMGVTGVRLSELLQIKVEDIKLGYLDVLGKGRKLRRVYIPKNTQEEIMQYLDNLAKSKYAYENTHTGYVIRRWNANNMEDKSYMHNTRDLGNFENLKSMRRNIEKVIQNAGERLGINKEVLHPHGFRHFFAKEFLKHRLDISLLADLLGHSSLEITRIYLKMTSAEQKEVIDNIVTW